MERLDRIRIGFKSKDTDIAKWYEQTEKLRGNLLSLTDAVKTFKMLSEQTNKAWLNVLDIIYDTYTFYNPDESILSDLNNVIAASRTMYQHLPVEFITQITTPIDVRVRSWTQELSSLKAVVDNAEKARVEFIHYEKKIQGLRADREKRRNQGKVDSEKQREELHRNEAKLVTATNGFETAKTIAIKATTNALDFRYKDLDPLLIGYINAQQNFFDGIKESLSLLDDARVHLKAVAARRYEDDGSILCYPLIRVDPFTTPSRSKSQLEPTLDPDAHIAAMGSPVWFEPQMESKIELLKDPAVPSQSLCTPEDPSLKPAVAPPDATEPLPCSAVSTESASNAQDTNAVVDAGSTASQIGESVEGMSQPVPE